MIFIILFSLCILGSGMAFVLVVLQIRWLKKMRGYVKVEALITKTVKEQWSGDTADRSGGEYDVPVAEFITESHKPISYILRDTEYMHYQVGQKITMVYPPDEPLQAVVFAPKKVIRSSITYGVAGLVMILVAILLWCGKGL